jgi:hypothetical protein
MLLLPDFFPWLIKIVVATRMPYCGMYSDCPHLQLAYSISGPEATSNQRDTFNWLVELKNSILLAYDTTSMENQIPFQGHVVSKTSRIDRL